MPVPEPSHESQADPALPARAAAGGAEVAFRLLARARRARPLHPRGVLLPATLTRTGSGATGCPLLDTPGELTGVLARVSRSAGLPAPWPDVWGLALRLPGSDGAPADLLLSGVVDLPRLRGMLRPARRLGGTLGTVVPYRAPDRSRVTLLARVVGNEDLPLALPDLAQGVSAGPVTMRLDAVRRGLRRPVAILELGGGAIPGVGPSFDPVLNPLPGLAMPASLAAARRRGYAGARAGRHAPPPA